jgi:hypothetical protein
LATPASAAEDYLRRTELTEEAVRVVRRQASSRGAAWVAAVIAYYQLLAARQAAISVPSILAEQGISSAATAGVATAALAGVSSAGYPLAVPLQTLAGTAQLTAFVATQVADAARNGAFLRMVATPSVTTWVRMLQPPSCPRCVVLAGKEFRSESIAAFERHPNCDCIAIPTDEAHADDLTTDPRAYFDSLSPEEQDRIFTKAGAEAIREGADIGQVVNARRGMRRAQVFGRDAWITLEGTTRRGLARRQMDLLGKSKKPVRLMPETIFAVAANRADAIRLLRLYGYLL